MFSLKKTKLLTAENKDEIVKTICEAERHTSGEIRVHIEQICEGGDPYNRAITIFNQVGMYKTKRRNGVLIYVAADDRYFSIIGDQGINEIVPANFWVEITEKMKAFFGEKKFTEGICFAVQTVGNQLKDYFPYEEGDQNELSNEISES